MSVGEMIATLKAAEREVRGDGFGYAGDLKSSYKKAIGSLLALQEQLAKPVPVAEAESLMAANPECFGFGVNNAAGCKCKKVFAPLVQR